MIFDDMVDTVGRTPVVRLNRLVPRQDARIFVKLERSAVRSTPRSSFPTLTVVAVDAYGSSIFGTAFYPYLMRGIGLSWRPVNLDVDVLDLVHRVTDTEAFDDDWLVDKGIHDLPATTQEVLDASRVPRFAPVSARGLVGESIGASHA